MQSTTYDILCKAVVIVLFCAFCYSLLIYYMQKTASLEKTLYDMENVTASDYTVELDISKEAYEYYELNQWPKGQNQNEPDSNDKYSEALYFKKYLSEKVPEILCEWKN